MLLSGLFLGSKEADEQSAQFLRIIWETELSAVVSVQGNIEEDCLNGALVEGTFIKGCVRECIKWTCVRIHLLYLLGICLLTTQAPFITVLNLDITHSLAR